MEKLKNAILNKKVDNLRTEEGMPIRIYSVDNPGYYFIHGAIMSIEHNGYIPMQWSEFGESSAGKDKYNLVTYKEYKDLGKRYLILDKKVIEEVLAGEYASYKAELYSIATYVKQFQDQPLVDIIKKPSIEDMSKIHKAPVCLDCYFSRYSALTQELYMCKLHGEETCAINTCDYHTGGYNE